MYTTESRVRSNSAKVGPESVNTNALASDSSTLASHRRSPLDIVDCSSLSMVNRLEAGGIPCHASLSVLRPGP